MPFRFPSHTRALVHGAIAAMAAILAGCGGDASDTGTPAAGPPQSSPPPSSSAPPSGNETAVQAAYSCALPDFQREMMERINRARAARQLCGSQALGPVAALAWNGKLFAAAAGHAEDMARHDYFSHTGRDGSTFSQRITNAGYAWSAAGENLAAGQIDVAQVVDAWMDSPGHCANLMSSHFTEVGVACVREEGSTYKQYWAMSLARPR